jgi:hypothetical protein
LLVNIVYRILGTEIEDFYRASGDPFCGLKTSGDPFCGSTEHSEASIQ